ncbi:MAG: hypothetical protein RI989_367, partial [Bacteroidota bacterium]
MKHTFLLFLFLLGIAEISNSQVNPFVAKAAELCEEKKFDEALAQIDEGFKSANLNADPNAWYVKGYILKELYKQKESNQRQSNYRFRSIVALKKAREFDSNMEYATNIDAALQFIAFTYFNDAILRTAEMDGESENEPLDLFKKFEELYQGTDAELKEKWSKWSRFQTVDRLYRKMENDSSKSFDTLELKSRNESVKLVKDWFKRWRKMDRADQISFYGNTLAEIYDPHTNYFPPADKDNFDISMTGKLEGIGATLSERDGYIKVERIVPGSASYKQGDLKAGDLILKVAQADEEAVDVVDMKLDDAIQLIRGKKGTVVKLTVKKPDGQIKIIPIIRDVVVIEESYARSFVFEYQSKKFGMIQLPSFYADFAARGRGRNCAGDVHNEIEKLKKLNVDGIVLD